MPPYQVRLACPPSRLGRKREGSSLQWFSSLKLSFKIKLLKVLKVHRKRIFSVRLLDQTFRYYAQCFANVRPVYLAVICRLRCTVTAYDHLVAFCYPSDCDGPTTSSRRQTLVAYYLVVVGDRTLQPFVTVNAVSHCGYTVFSSLVLRHLSGLHGSQNVSCPLGCIRD